MTAFLALRKNPLPVLFVFAVLVSFSIHAWNRDNHFQECDSSVVYDALYNFPRSQLSFNANTYPKGGTVSPDIAAKIVSNPVVEEILQTFAKDFSKEQIIARLTETGIVPLIRFGEIAVVQKLSLPHALQSFFALPLGSTYSAGAGLLYGLVSGRGMPYEGFMFNATLLTLAVFHAAVLLLFFAVLKAGVNKYAAALAGLWMLFGVSLYSYGYHLGSTVWNITTSALWLWALIAWADKPSFLRRMSWLTGILVFFNYLIVLWWAALLLAQGLEIWRSGTRREKIRKTFGLFKAQWPAFLGLVIAAVLFYPPSQTSGGIFPLEVFSDFYFIILNFASFHAGNGFLDAIQFLLGTLAAGAGFIFLWKRREEMAARTLLCFFGLFLLAAALGVLPLLPGRHILFLTPAFFLVAAFGIGRAIEKWKVRESALILCALILCLGLWGLYDRIEDTRAVAKSIPILPEAEAIIIEDCGWSFIYRNFGREIPAYHTEARILKAGKTYLYISQSRSLDTAAARWEKDYGLGITLRKIEESAKITDIYFTAYNPRRLAHTRANNLFTATFEIVSVSPW